MPGDPPNVEELIPTRDSLLSRLKDWGDDASWRDFFNTYWKLVHGVALKAGLSEQEAQELSVRESAAGTLPNDNEVQRWDDVKPLIA